uniref:Peptidase S1 domain-containing protein n=1 Tax=Timema monikensis TaxID=170555 RepID=A0A7R9ECK0_9NEOP|nr:unnamed protein product [Timema monikensis]
MARVGRPPAFTVLSVDLSLLSKEFWHVAVVGHFSRCCSFQGGLGLEGRVGDVGMHTNSLTPSPSHKMLSHYWLPCLLAAIVTTEIHSTAIERSATEREGFSYSLKRLKENSSIKDNTTSAVFRMQVNQRRKRFVRFPSGGEPTSGSRLLYPRPHTAPSYYQPSSGAGYSSWHPVRPKAPSYHSKPPPVMGHRTPRLVFRDPDIPGTVHASAQQYYQQNGLQDLLDEEPRDTSLILLPDTSLIFQADTSLIDTSFGFAVFNLSNKPGGYPFLGDQSMCSTGNCEFFLFCWMSAGLLEGSCGGFLYACCQRKGGTAKKSENLQPLASSNDLQTLAADYGPVLNDPTKSSISAETSIFPAVSAPILRRDMRSCPMVLGCGVSIGKLGPSLGAQRRIVGGDEAGFGSFPWQAYIRIGSSRCGGSLVNRYHVITAGHCVARASARQVQVTLGDYVINSAVEPLPAYTFGVREIRVHPYFKFTPQADRFDVAVLKLDRPVQYMPHIAPICLPEKGEDFLGQYGWAAGWGALQAGSRLRPKTLQAVDVPVIDNRLCERWHKGNGINVVIYDEMMCAGYRGGSKDSCQGDSGGPLMMEKTGRWYLIGIVSAGYSCAQRGQPGIYHRVAHTVDWISYIINS